MKESLFLPLKALYDYVTNYNKNLPKNKQIFLNGDDIILWKYIFDFYTSENETIKEKIINNKRYIWIAHKKILDDLPFLNIGSKRSLRRKINKLKALKLIYIHTDTKEGNKSYFAIPSEILVLMTKSHKSYDKMTQSLVTKSHNPYDKISHNSIVNNIVKDNKLYIKSIPANFENTIREELLTNLIKPIRKLFGLLNLKAYKEENYLKVYLSLLEEYNLDIEEFEDIISYQALIRMDNINQIETLINPNYTKKEFENFIKEYYELKEMSNYKRGKYKKDFLDYLKELENKKIDNDDLIALLEWIKTFYDYNELTLTDKELQEYEYYSRLLLFRYSIRRIFLALNYAKDGEDFKKSLTNPKYFYDDFEKIQIVLNKRL